MNNSLHPLDLLALEAGTLILVLDSSIRLEFARQPGKDVIADLTSSFDRAGYRIHQLFVTTPLHYYIDLHPSIDANKVAEFLEGLFDRHGMIHRREYAPAGRRWQYAN